NRRLRVERDRATLHQFVGDKARGGHDEESGKGRAGQKSAVHDGAPYPVEDGASTPAGSRTLGGIRCFFRPVESLHGGGERRGPGRGVGGRRGAAGKSVKVEFGHRPSFRHAAASRKSTFRRLRA